MKAKSILLLSLLTVFALMPNMVRAQNKEFVIKKLKQYWTDKSGQPWNDTTYKMAVRIDPQYAKDIGVDEISVDDTNGQAVTYATGEWRFFGLKRDAKGTYADVDYLTYKDSTDPVIYQVELQKDGKAAPFSSGSSKIEVRNDSIDPRAIALKQSNAIFLKDWLLIGGVMIAGLILIYIIVFRWLFSGLLFKWRWAVMSAEHFTWSLSLLMLLGLASALTLLFLGPRFETWIIVGVMGAFWLLHGVVWLISGKEA